MVGSGRGNIELSGKHFILKMSNAFVFERNEKSEIGASRAVSRIREPLEKSLIKKLVETVQYSCQLIRHTWAVLDREIDLTFDELFDN